MLNDSSILLNDFSTLFKGFAVLGLLDDTTHNFIFGKSVLSFSMPKRLRPPAFQIYKNRGSSAFGEIMHKKITFFCGKLALFRISNSMDPSKVALDRHPPRSSWGPALPTCQCSCDAKLPNRLGDPVFTDILK